jgi:hypothetical protein
MNLHKLVTPKAVTRISHAEFAGSFLDLLSDIENGTVFRVTGNPAIEAINRDFVQPARAAGRLKEFRQDTPALYDRQIVQRAITLDLPLPDTTLLDSTLRLRRTEGKGAFVGPHIDVHEDLPVDGLNFWISFSPLGREETVQFLPPEWILGGTPIGHFKSGVYRDDAGRTMPFEALEKSAVSSEIEPGEYFAFYSGRTAHCSPFYVKGERITADQRMILTPTPEGLIFGHHTHFYPVGKLNAFDGAVPVKSVTADYWSASGDHPVPTPYPSPIDEMANNLHAAHRVARASGVGADTPGADRILGEADRSINPRSEMLTHTRDAAARRLLKRDLVNLVPEVPNRIYPEIVKSDLFHVLSLAWHRGMATGGLVAALNAIVLLILIRLMVDFGGLAGHRVKTVLINRLSMVTWQQLHGTGQPGEARNV